jgi:hypothetical protein
MDVEQLLRASTPEPSPGFVHSLEAELFPAKPERRHRPLLAAAAVVVGLACAALGLSLAGVGPLAGSGNDVQAGSNCRFVTVTRHEQTPVLVNGQMQFREQPVQRRVKRCS